MPQTKKTSGKKPVSRTKSAGTGGKKTSQKKKTAGTKPQENAFLPQLTPVILIVCAVLIEVCVIVNQGVVGQAVRRVLTGLFGASIHALFLLMILRAILLYHDRAEGHSIGRSFATAAMQVLLAAFQHVLNGGTEAKDALDVALYYENGQALFGGGAVGGVPGQLLLLGVGRICSVIILAALLLLVALYIAGLTPRGVAVFFAYSVGRIADRVREKRAAAAQTTELEESTVVSQ